MKQGRFSLIGMLGAKPSPHELTNKEEEHAAKGMITVLNSLSGTITSFMKEPSEKRFAAIQAAMKQLDLQQSSLRNLFQRELTENSIEELSDLILHEQDVLHRSDACLQHMQDAFRQLNSLGMPFERRKELLKEIIELCGEERAIQEELIIIQRKQSSMLKQHAPSTTAAK